MNKMSELQVTIESLRPDVVGITETWTNPDIMDAELVLEGYVMFRRDRQNCRVVRGGGVLLYVKDEWRPVEFIPETKFPEHAWCKLFDGSRELLIGVCYRTPSVIFEVDCHGLLRDLLVELADRSVLLMGDFNYGEIKWGRAGMEGSVVGNAELFYECLEDNFYSQYVNKPTRGDNVLDLVICNEPNLVGEVKVIEHLADSDHGMVTWSVVLERGSKRVDGRHLDYNRADFESMRHELQEVNWDEVLEGDVNGGWTRFKEVLKRVEERYIPVKTGKRKGKAPWITYKAVRAIERKRRVYSKYKDRDHPACKSANKEASRSVREAKIGFELKLSENIQQDSKSFYAYVRSKSKTRVKPSSLSDGMGGTIESPEEVAEEFNKYFSSVFSNERVGEMPEPRVEGNREFEGIDDMDITCEMVRSKLLGLREDKSPGADDILPRLLLNIREEICYPLSELYRKSLRDGVVPEDWRRANVVPIFKAGSRFKAENYRPVSLTSQICKIMEKIIRDELVAHLEGKGLLRNSQHGFRKGRSCLTNLLRFLDGVTSGVDRKESVDVIYLDFAKAFDKVPHQRMLRKLKGYGVTGRILKWIESWLSDRFQRVCIGGGRSGWRRVTSGIPQGSVLGPILFLVFIDDLDEGIKSRILKFADDTKMFGRVDRLEDRLRLQEDLDKVVDWSEDWQMKFNVEKCKVMHLGNMNAGESYYMDNSVLKVVEEEKDLGVWIRNDLKVSSQCNGAYKKANMVLGLIRRNIEHKSPLIMVRLYKSLVRPHLEYSMVAWSPYYAKDKEKLERVQRRFTKMVWGLERLDYSERARRLGLMSLEERRNRADLIELFRMVRGLSSIPLEEFFEIDRTGRTRGHLFKMRKNNFRTEVRRYFFSQRVVNRWNGLRSEDVAAESVNAFKRRLELRRREKMDLLAD